MILGVSHIVLGSTNLSDDRDLFERLGWTTQFEERHIPTPPGKRPFMTTTSAEQGLLFLQPPAGTPVELIHYADTLADTSASPLQIVLPQPPDLQSFECVGDVAALPDIQAYRSPRLTCPLWFSASPRVPSLIVHFVTDLEKAARFWTDGVGFRPAGPASPESATLEFRSVIPQWRATLRLIAGAPPTQASLDGAGFRCLSVVSSDPKRAINGLRAAGGGDSTGPIELIVNRKPLSLELLRGPDGVFIEVLGTQLSREAAG
ncbi:MAG TPA: hypothetical protein VEA16_11295 [Vicinamibacterales bacterium]|nr:hypothetical protein [Vicinamibacterales bacterium]